MKKLISLGFVLIAINSLNSCVILSTKKYRSMVAQGDSISNDLNMANIKIASLESEILQLKADTTQLNQRIADLQNRTNELNTNYASLRSNSASEINKLYEDLRERESRLNEVEEILRNRDEATAALKNKLHNALLGFQQNGLSIDIKNGMVYVSLTDKLLFDAGSIIIDDKGKEALQELAKVLKTQPELNISVEGHTDNQRVGNLGQIKDNWDLSVLRATSVIRYLTDIENLAPERITATGKGEYKPIMDGSSPDSRSQNRRIEIVLSPKLDELYNLISK